MIYSIIYRNYRSFNLQKLFKKKQAVLRTIINCSGSHEDSSREIRSQIRSAQRSPAKREVPGTEINTRV